MLISPARRRGVDGHVEPLPVGQVTYAKLGVTCRLEVLLMEVTEQHQGWSEDTVRVRGWFSIRDAARLLDHPELARLLHAADPRVRD